VQSIIIPFLSIYNFPILISGFTVKKLIDNYLCRWIVQELLPKREALHFSICHNKTKMTQRIYRFLSILFIRKFVTHITCHMSIKMNICI
jgi:hypothetical protein